MSLIDSPFVFRFARIFDYIEKKWESKSFLKVLSFLLVGSYLLAILLIQLKYSGIIAWRFIPDNHFKAIELAFTLLLFFEVVSLVFSLVKSISVSMETQLQILSLILLRNAFKMFGEFPESFAWTAIHDKIYFMFADAFGALVIFSIIIFIRRIDRHRTICKSVDEQQSFVNIKKIIAIVLLVIFLSFIALDIYHFFQQEAIFSNFQLFPLFLYHINI